MAKGKKKNNNNGYFQRNTQQLGSDFLRKKTAKDIRHDFRNIFRDIAHSIPEGKDANVHKLVEYFNNLTFVSNLLAAANEEFVIANATNLGLMNYIQNIQAQGLAIDPSWRLEERMIMARNQSIAYSIITAHLNNIISLFNISADEDWLRANILIQLKSLSVQLSKYKRII